MLFTKGCFVEDVLWWTMCKHDVDCRMVRDRVHGRRLLGDGGCGIEAVDVVRIGKGPVVKLGLPRRRVDLWGQVSVWFFLYIACPRHIVLYPKIDVCRRSVSPLQTLSPFMQPNPRSLL